LQRRSEAVRGNTLIRPRFDPGRSEAVRGISLYNWALRDLSWPVWITSGLLWRGSGSTSVELRWGRLPPLGARLMKASRTAILETFLAPMEVGSGHHPWF
jgi:hypothetical protein